MVPKLNSGSESKQIISRKNEKDDDSDPLIANSEEEKFDCSSHFTKYNFTILFILLISIILLFDIILYWNSFSFNFVCKSILSSKSFYRIDESFLLNTTIEDVLRDSIDSPEILVPYINPSNAFPKFGRCSHYSCFDLYRCGLIQYNPSNSPIYRRRSFLNEKIKVFVYPQYKFSIDSQQNLFDVSLQFRRILSAILSSPYYTNKPEEACLFIPNIDLLNFQHINADRLEKILWSLPYFRQLNGSNHLLYIMMNGRKKKKKFNSAKAIIASGVFNDVDYRLNFDIATPIYSLFSQLYESSKFELLSFDASIIAKMKRKWTVISTQSNLIPLKFQNVLTKMESIVSNRMILVGFNCTLKKEIASFKRHLPFVTNKSSETILDLYHKTYVCNNDRRLRIRYLDLLHQAEFCLIMKSKAPGIPLLSDALMSGCIPLIIDDNFVMPFQERIDWTSISIKIREHSINNLFEIIDKLSNKRRRQLRINGLNIWNRFFRTIENISLTTLDIINERVYPKPKNILVINNDRMNELTPLSFEFFSNGFNYISPKNLNLLSDGFTTVILTYNRFESLNKVIASVSRVPSCSKILIIWNNRLERPPSVDQWVSSSIPIQVIITKENKLSNRFFPYNSIETEAIFAIDDDITMLNPDEIEFSYQTWREFPDRIVGFPSRLHFWNNLTHAWNYDSEWKNKISLILTGAAFYHNYYNYLYTYALPSSIRDWVDKNMNCEDIAMNFMVSNVTSKAPIKVTPRKKFKCPECTKSNSLSVDVVRHLRLRSNCVDYFARIFKTMPLKAVEFRSDPVLFRDNIPEKFKHYSLIGNL